MSPYSLLIVTITPSTSPIFDTKNKIMVVYDRLCLITRCSVFFFSHDEEGFWNKQQTERYSHSFVFRGPRGWIDRKRTSSQPYLSQCFSTLAANTRTAHQRSRPRRKIHSHYGQTGATIKTTSTVKSHVFRGRGTKRLVETTWPTSGRAANK